METAAAVGLESMATAVVSSAVAVPLGGLHIECGNGGERSWGRQSVFAGHTGSNLKGPLRSSFNGSRLDTTAQQNVRGRSLIGLCRAMQLTMVRLCVLTRSFVRSRVGRVWQFIVNCSVAGGIETNLTLLLSCTDARWGFQDIACWI